MEYWIYENWRAEKKAVIHKASCSFCNYGKGIKQKKQDERNGKWHGQFKDYEEARQFAFSLNDRAIKECNFCM